MVILKRFFGGIIFLAGAWLLFLEIGISLSESHSIKSKDLPVIVGVVCIGVGLIYGGVRLVGSRQIVGILLYAFALFLLYVIFSDPKSEGGNWLELLPCFFFPLCLITGGTLLLIKNGQRTNKSHRL